MDKNQISRGTHASVLSTANRQLSWTRILLLSLFLAFSLASLRPTASAQAADQRLQENQAVVTNRQPTAAARNAPPCEQLLVECLASGAGAAFCGAQYDVCIEGGQRSYDRQPVR